LATKTSEQANDDGGSSDNIAGQADDVGVQTDDIEVDGDIEIDHVDASDVNGSDSDVGQDVDSNDNG